MRSAILLASLASLSSVAFAQGEGYGRFPCTIVNGDGTLSPDQSQCATGLLVSPGSGDGGSQGDNPTPIDPTCFQDGASGRYFCGIAGAPCTTSDNCDNSQCVNGVCGGAPGATCNGDDAQCAGFLYCTDDAFNPTAADVCGGFGAYCADPTQGDPSLTDAENQNIFNRFCATGFCSYQFTSTCLFEVTNIGGDCSVCTQTPQGQALDCVADATTGTSTCQVAVVAPQPSNGRARERRNRLNLERSLCPASHSACSIDGGKGFECIDTQNNIEQCGACASAGGVDCSSLPGVEAVGCVAGTCEIWSCADGYQWDSDSSSCKATLA
ncbi:hypothetical protein JCM8547_003058 [Rhodosporidiobolus lusitaniae]